MSDKAAASHQGGHDAHDAHDDGAVHAHVSSVPFYVAIFVALLFFTVLTVGQSYVDLGKMNLLAVILIATCKASLVVTFFMHLRHDNKFHALIFVCGLMFIGVFFTYTMNDTEHRGGELDESSGVRVEGRTGLLAPGGFDIAKAEEEHKKEAEDFEKNEGHGGGAEHAAPAGSGDKAPVEHEHH